MHKNRRCRAGSAAYINCGVGGAASVRKDAAPCRPGLFVPIPISVVSPALATPAIVDFQSIGYQNNLASEQRTIGWVFTALDDIAVTHLGIWDHAGDGLLASHLTGICDAGGALLGSTSVPSGTAATPVGGTVGGGVFR
ncbi:MAG: hypothetical protein VW644_01015 [Alphaproteobacteria bacterium]|jgi:hypothetical protein